MSEKSAAVVQACLTHCGHTKVIFDDGSVVSLSPCGSLFIHSSGGVADARQLSEYALTKYTTKLSLALEFRNLHCDVPFYTTHTLRSLPPSTFSVGFVIDEVCWAATIHEAEQAGKLLVMGELKLVLKSQDGFASVVLHPNKRLAVCYPLLVGQQDDSNLYKWQNSLFSLSNYPPRWSAAVHLLVKASKLKFGSSFADDRIADALPGFNLPAATNSCVSKLPSASQRWLTASCKTFHEHTSSWLVSNDTGSLPTAMVGINTLWTDQVTYQCDACTASHVHAWIHADESCLTMVKSGRFFVHQWNDARPAKVYSADALSQGVGPSGLCGPSTLQLPSAHPNTGHLHTIALQLKRLGLGCPSQAHRQPTPPPATHSSITTSTAHDEPSPLQQQAACYKGGGSRERECTGSMKGMLAVQDRGRPGCRGGQEVAAWDVGEAAGALGLSLPSVSGVPSQDVVIDLQHVHDLGECKAFADGRIQILFVDRTLLYLEPGWQICRLVLPDGTRVCVNVSNPVGVQVYVQAAMEYGQWAFSDSSARGFKSRLQAAVQLKILETQRMAALCRASAGCPTDGSKELEVGK